MKKFNDNKKTTRQNEQNHNFQIHSAKKIKFFARSHTDTHTPVCAFTVNSASNSAAESNSVGSKKLSSAHNSCKLFCSGVPVSSRRCDEVKVRRVSERTCGGVDGVEGVEGRGEGLRVEG